LVIYAANASHSAAPARGADHKTLRVPTPERRGPCSHLSSAARRAAVAVVISAAAAFPAHADLLAARSSAAPSVISRLVPAPIPRRTHPPPLCPIPSSRTCWPTTSHSHQPVLEYIQRDAAVDDPFLYVQSPLACALCSAPHRTIAVDRAWLEDMLLDRLKLQCASSCIHSVAVLRIRRCSA
jgi:hypothetical protein